jgi:riboflavin synthase
MFTGIIEGLGEVLNIKREGTNIRFQLNCEFQSELKVDQSVSHDGVCLTVDALKDQYYEVVAIDETLSRTNLKTWKTGQKVNLERSMRADGRFDGHIVQGHVDNLGTLEKITEEDGSWRFFISHSMEVGITVEKGSISVNGVSLTVVDSKPEGFSVAIIPYTNEHTNFQNLVPGDLVNLEFDIVGKYLKKFVNQ